MGLQFVLGGSGSGKSEYIYKNIIDKSIKNPENNYIVVVPEQYTMATQKKLVQMHPRKGILNIDVVSFERLSYKVFAEIGGENREVLDDTGKSLIIRHLLEQHKRRLGYFGSGINKQGFVAELKSVISELLQYDISTEKLKEIREASADNRLLYAKLGDISVVYSAFKEYLSDNFITSEEILDVLCQVVDRSDMVKKSEFVFDGFTGFTPIQYKLLNLLLINSRGVQISAAIDSREAINVYEGMHNLFFMSKEMYAKLIKICDESHIEILKPVILDEEINPRFIQDGYKALDISFLEKNIFRFDGKRFAGKPENINIYSAMTPKNEVEFAVAKILELTRFKGYRYRDIAVISADMAGYGKLCGNICEQNDIPVFVDNKKSITDNPFVEFIRASIEVVLRGFTYDSVFRMLRTSMMDISREDVDLLENYCIAVGIRGYRQWSQQWTKRGKGRNAYPLERLNELRIMITTVLLPLYECLKTKGATVRQYIEGLYQYIESVECQNRIDELSALAETGSEYEQLYKKITELFDTTVSLLGDEKLTLREFSGIMDAGFAEIKVGLIPPTADCVMVGDIERTRLDNVKVLIFVGVNEGIVPKSSENRSILSETDRYYLENMDVKLSQTVREKAFVQKFYLYLCMTKTSQKLYITYANRGNDGSSKLPSYIIRNLLGMFPQMKITVAADVRDELKYIKIPKSDLSWDEGNLAKTISENLALEMYGDELYGSISSFETFSSCKFAYFLRYGLNLEEREEYKFAVNDFGTVLHAVIEQVSRIVSDAKESISLLEDEKRRRLVRECIDNVTRDYKDTILKDSSRNEFMIKRMTDLADRTMWTIGKQLQSGLFRPDEYEKSFVMDSEINVDGTDTRKLSMRGVIDRIDICEDDDNVYVRVVDYKSGKSDFELIKTYYALKLQLVTYMKAAMRLEAVKHPDKNIVPAGIFYYNIDNPIIETDSEDEAEINEKIQEALRMKGVVNDKPEIVRLMDDTSDSKSLVVPVAFKKDGSFDNSRSKIISTRQFGLLTDFISEKAEQIGKDVLKGSIDINPYEDGNRNSCEYCSYRAVCGFSRDLDSYRYRHLKKFKDEEIWKKIGEEVSTDGKMDR